MPTKKTTKSGAYVEGVGRRKTAIARVRLLSGTGEVTINGKEGSKYFSLSRLMTRAIAPLELLKLADKYSVSAKVQGGGITAQADAICHGLARAVADANPAFRSRLSVEGLLKRDPRMVERKKYGLKKARRAPQWQKR